jgi:hypothetical protein
VSSSGTFVTDSTEKSPTLEAESSLASQKYIVFYETNWINPVHTLTPYFFKIHFNIIFTIYTGKYNFASAVCSD